MYTAYSLRRRLKTAEVVYVISLVSIVTSLISCSLGIPGSVLKREGLWAAGAVITAWFGIPTSITGTILDGVNYH